MPSYNWSGLFSRSGKPLLSICHSRLTASAEQNNTVSNCQAELKQLCLSVQHTEARRQHVKKLTPHTITAALAPVQVANGEKPLLALPHAASQV